MPTLGVTNAPGRIQVSKESASLKDKRCRCAKVAGFLGRRSPLAGTEHPPEDPLQFLDERVAPKRTPRRLMPAVVGRQGGIGFLGQEDRPVPASDEQGFGSDQAVVASEKVRPRAAPRVVASS